MHLRELKDKSINELVKLAESMGLENVARLRKQDIIFAILKAHAKSGENIYGGGVLEILQDGFGFLRSSEASYLAGLMIFMFLRARLDVSACVPVIPSVV